MRFIVTFLDAASSVYANISDICYICYVDIYFSACTDNDKFTIKARNDFIKQRCGELYVFHKRAIELVCN